MPNSTPSPSPSLMEILQAVQMMNPPAQATAVVNKDEDRGVTKAIVGGICAMLGAIILALIFWVGSSVNGLGTTVTKMSANVDQLQKSIADLQQTQGTATQQLSDIRTTNAKQDAEQDAVKADIVRMKERLRIVEGQKPLKSHAEVE
jgi:septal ring factor EnvC (AmiA/AmiB activator)